MEPFSKTPAGLHPRGGLAAIAIFIPTFLAIPLAILMALAASGCSSSSGQVGGDQQLRKNRELVLDFEEKLVNFGDSAALADLVGSTLVQHDPHIAGGRDAWGGYLGDLRAGNPQLALNVKRVVAQGDLVVVHSNLILSPGTPGNANFEIFRIAGDKIVEHWATTEAVPATTASGHPMFSTESSPQVSEPDPTASADASKQVAMALFNEALVNGDVTAFDRYVGGAYYQHNPMYADGTAAVKAAFGGPRGVSFSVSIKRVVADGDLVAIHVNYSGSAFSLAAVDLFRVREGKVVEHWDVVEQVSPTAANSNGVF